MCLTPSGGGIKVLTEKLCANRMQLVTSFSVPVRKTDSERVNKRNWSPRHTRWCVGCKCKVCREMVFSTASGLFCEKMLTS